MRFAPCALMGPQQRPQAIGANCVPPRDGLHNALRSLAARNRAVYGVAFLANSRAIGCKNRLVSHPDSHHNSLTRVMQTIPGFLGRLGSSRNAVWPSDGISFEQ